MDELGYCDWTWLMVDRVPAHLIEVTPVGTLSATSLQAALAELDSEKAPLASPTFTGNPTAPTASTGDNDTSLATTAFVQTAAGLLIPKSLVDAKGDLLVGTADNTVARKAVGADGRVLTADSAQSDGLSWVAPVTGFSDPLTTKGDLIARTSTTTVRKAVGANGTVLMADSTVAEGLDWKVQTGIRTALFKVPGTLTVVAGTTRLYNDTGLTWTILSVRASVETAPSGGSVIVDVNKNGTTIFTTQANRPTITTGNTTSGKVTNANITSVADGDFMTVDIDATTAPAADMTLTLVVSY